jgi:flagellar hook-associated protein 1 FlgK
MDVRAIPSSVKGGITLVMGGGTILPLDEKTDLLSIDNLTVSATTDAWSVPPPAAIRVGGRELPGMDPGGRMGERLELRDKTLVRMQSEVDLVAAALATRFEQQGIRLFTGSNPAVAPATPTIPAAIGFAAQIRVNPAVTSNPALMRDGTPAMANTSGVDGFKDVLNNVLTYAFGAKRDAATDHPALPGTGLGPSGQLASRFSPPRTIVEYAAAVSGAHTAEAAAAEQQADEMKTYRTHITSLVQRREGVDVDAEMAGMVQLQNAYAANARVMAAVQSMWDALLASVR